MKFTLFSGDRASLPDLAVDLLAIALYKENLNESEIFNLISQRLDGHLARIAEEERFLGKPQQTLMVHTHGKLAGPRLLLVGVGSKGESAGAELRHAAAKVSRSARNVGIKRLGLVLPPGRSDARAVELAAEGLLLGRYKFDRY